MQLFLVPYGFFKILQARLQQYMNRELPDVQAGLEKAEEPEIMVRCIFCLPSGMV